MFAASPAAETEAPPARKPATLFTLQAGRGLAALAVVAHHSTLAARDFGGQPLSWVRFGYLGVDYFFVLSGFIIYHTTAGRDRTLTGFLSARAKRVYLPYLPIAIGLALMYVLVPGSAHGHQWTWPVTLTLAPMPQNSALTIAWTLQHEVLFYLVFALFYFSGLLPLGLAVWAIAILFLGGAIPFKLINLEFLMGIACAAFYRRARPAVLLLAPVPIAIWVALGHWRADSALVGLGLAFAVGPLARLEELGRIRIARTLVVLGAASYSLYLVHAPVVTAVAHVVPGNMVVPSAIAASLVAGFAYHHLVELQLLRRRLFPELFCRWSPERRSAEPIPAN